jgi:hypothetical protein
MMQTTYAREPEVMIPQSEQEDERKKTENSPENRFTESRTAPRPTPAAPPLGIVSATVSIMAMFNDDGSTGQFWVLADEI